MESVPSHLEMSIEAAFSNVEHAERRMVEQELENDIYFRLVASMKAAGVSHIGDLPIGEILAAYTNARF
jgi:hypothetical protein